MKYKNLKNGTPEEHFDNLFLFKPSSPGSIIKNLDISFSMPQGGIGNMVAIQSGVTTTQIFPATEGLDTALALEASEILNKIEKDNGTFENQKISIVYKPEIGDHRAKKLTENSSTDSALEFNFDQTYIIPNIENREQEKLLSASKTNLEDSDEI